jgi:hypothetical protein
MIDFSCVKSNRNFNPGLEDFFDNRIHRGEVSCIKRMRINPGIKIPGQLQQIDLSLKWVMHFL